MKIKKILMLVAIVSLLCCYGCGKDTASSAGEETSVSKENTDNKKETAETSSPEAETPSTEGETAGDNTSESDPTVSYDPVSDGFDAETEHYGQVVVTGIEEWESVGYSIAGFSDGSLFQLQYVDEQGNEINGDYTPGTPDKLVFEFGPAGEIMSATYYGTYNDEDSVSLAIEACSANSYLMGDDILGIASSDTTIIIALDPHSARFNNTIRTYFLEGTQDPAGYTKAVEKNYESTSRDKASLKGDNFACDVIRGLKVTWYK